MSVLSVRPIVCVQMTGVLCDSDGNVIPGASSFSEELVKTVDVYVVIEAGMSDATHTHPGKKITSTVTWLLENNIRFTQVWAGRGLPPCIAYISDHAVRCEPGRLEKGDPRIQDQYNRAVRMVDVLKA